MYTSQKLLDKSASPDLASLKMRKSFFIRYLKKRTSAKADKILVSCVFKR